MVKHLLLSEKELQEFGGNALLSTQMKALLKQQYNSWELLHNNYSGLENVKIKVFQFDNFKVKVQFNPSRITSSAAKVDAESIKGRKSFLHYNNLPKEQKGLLFKDDYLILCNPYPIFKEHFTIPVINQAPQSIDGNYKDFLDLTKEIADSYVVFYNGPKCGASAPDHMHFQAGNKNFMPIDTEYNDIINQFGVKLIDKSSITIISVSNYLRNFIAVESDDISIAENYFYRVLNALKEVTNSSEEPLINLLGYYDQNKYITIIFPREKHRPDYYFLEGEKNILLSPASVDMGGVCITPLEKDFNKITKDEIIDIYKQVTLDNLKFKALCDEIKTFT